MAYLLKDLTADIIAMSSVDYANKSSVKQYNKISQRAAAFWLGKISKWKKAELTEFEKLAESENPYVSSYIIQALILEKVLPSALLDRYRQKLEQNIARMENNDAKTTHEIWLELWKKGMIKTVN